MKRVFPFVLLAALVAAARLLGPRLGRRCMEHCSAMFDEMPEDFPPRRMLRELETIHAQNDRILALLERDR